MRLSVSGRTIHLGYCTNVLPGEDVAALCSQLRRIARPLRQELGVDELGIGLWIARPAADELLKLPTARASLRRALADAGAYVFTLNGFPYGGFHAPRVKEKVFAPDWADPLRLSYTMDLARILAGLLPEDVFEASISTVPLGAAGVDVAAARAQLAQAVQTLEALEKRDHRRIRICLEPEPGAALETCTAAAGALTASPHTGLCLDTCHAAVVGEDPIAALAAMHAAGVVCGKVQISSALTLDHPSDDAERARLMAFDEPRFYHQVRTTGGGVMDLPEAAATLPRDAPWRVHFHVPIDRSDFGGGLHTTSSSIPAALHAALHAGVSHFEVETYTWNVLPEADRPKTEAELIQGMARELRWAREKLLAST